MNSTTIAVDVAKSVFEVAISEQPGQVRERQRLSRERFRRFLTERPAATVLMEACGSAHHWARHANAHGHRAVLVPPHVVRPYVPRNKTDRTDAKGLLEAFRNEDVHPVPVKSESQQALAALHRLRSTWLAARTARPNTVRAPLCQLPRAHAPRGLDRAAPPAGRDQQARRYVPAHALDPRRPLGALSRQDEDGPAARPTARVGAAGRTPAWAQQGRRRAGQ